MIQLVIGEGMVQDFIREQGGSITWDNWEVLAEEERFSRKKKKQYLSRFHCFVLLKDNSGRARDNGQNQFGLVF